MVQCRAGWEKCNGAQYCCNKKENASCLSTSLYLTKHSIRKYTQWCVWIHIQHIIKRLTWTRHLSPGTSVTGPPCASRTLCLLGASGAGQLDTLYGDSNHLFLSPGEPQHLGKGWHAVTGCSGNSSIKPPGHRLPVTRLSFSAWAEVQWIKGDGRVFDQAAAHTGLREHLPQRWILFFFFFSPSHP